MKNLTIGLIISLILVQNIRAQNLVPNGSFENYANCPEGPSELNNANGWATPDSATPDYYNACFNDLSPMMLPSMDVPDNTQGYQHAHTGEAYGGIICYDGSMGGTAADYREYMRIQLTSPLTAGTEYKVRFWWSLANKSPYSVEQIGILITDEYINYFGGGQNYISALPYTPTISTSGSQLADTSTWGLHEECFIASGGEEWIYIGNFRDQYDVNYDDTGVTCDMEIGGCYAYYYIDDVSIIDDISAIEVNMIPHEDLVIPNVITPNGDNKNDTWQIKGIEFYDKININIFNHWGQLIFSFNGTGSSYAISKNQWNGTSAGNKLMFGTYFYTIEMDDIYHHKGTITLIK